MGIHGLATFLAAHADQVGARVDLVALARQRSKPAAAAAPTLLIDGLSLLYHLEERGCQEEADGGAHGVHRTNMVLAGEDCARMDADIALLAATAAAGGLRLECVLDAGYGTHWGEYQRKRSTAEARAAEKESMREALTAYCLHPELVDAERPGDPGGRLGMRQFVASLRRNRVDVTFALGEADDELFARSRQYPNTLAVATSDTDFAVVHGVCLADLRYLDWTSQPGCLWARLFTPARVAAALRLPESSLPDLAALCGNDITAPWLDALKLPVRLGMPCSPVNGRYRVAPAAVAEWLRGLGFPLDELPALRETMATTPALAEALKASAAFYQGRTAEPPSSSVMADAAALKADGALRPDDLGQVEPVVLRRRFVQASLPSDIVAIARNGVAHVSHPFGDPGVDGSAVPLLHASHLPLNHVRGRAPYHHQWKWGEGEGRGGRTSRAAATPHRASHALVVLV